MSKGIHDELCLQTSVECLLIISRCYEKGYDDVDKLFSPILSLNPD